MPFRFRTDEATLEKRAHAPLKEITLVRTPGANSTSKHHNVIKQMKIVVKVPMHCDKCRTKALKIAAAAHGVSKVSIGANEDHVEVIGDGVDSVCLARSLRKKFGCSCTLVKVEEVKADKPGKKPPDEPVKKPPPCPCPCPAPPPCPCPAPKPCPAPPPCPCPAPPPCLCPAPKPCPAPPPCPCPAPPPCPCPAPPPCPAPKPEPCSAPSPSCVQNCCATQFRPMYCEVVHEYPEPTTCSIM